MIHKGKISENDSEKIKRLYEEYKNIMYFEAYKILKDIQLSEDAVQQSFIKLVGHLEKVEEDNFAKTKNFLTIICRNVAIDSYKKRATLNSNIDYIDEITNENLFATETKSSPCDIIIDNETLKNIFNAVEKLPSIYRDMILLEKLYGYSKKEICCLLDLNYETVKKRIIRAKKMLMEMLNEEDKV